MDGLKIEKLTQFWLEDRYNEALLTELLLSISLNNKVKGFSELYSKIPFSISTPVQIHAQSVELLIQDNNQIQAYEHLENYKNEMSVWYFYFHALLRFIEGDVSGCQKKIEPIYHNRELPKSCYLLLARALYLQGELQTVRQILDEYLDENVNSEAYGLYAMCMLDLGDLAAAKASSKIALQYDASQIDALIASASCDISDLQMTAAASKVKRCLEKNKSLGRVWSLAGQIELYCGNYNDAKDCFDKAIQNMPNHIGTYHLSAWVSLILNDIAQAEVLFNKALKLNPNFADSHAGLAIVALSTGQIDAAQQLIRKSIRLDPNSFTARYAQSLLLERLGDEQQATELLESILGSKTGIVSGPTYYQLIEKAVKDMNTKMNESHDH
ncbi:hypothetical protein BB427_14015 [Pseudoalteromonas sp. BMB]|uniref:tetratricopeptide repeat protein n=1 Tax=Pseudoalteromonas sp. BMB TaxID=1874619 RepID=UPI00083D40E0|nr:tetratricopeptide repeat protein [Pseudoalteromonas sp. BMB]ODB37108.1 hypothetical protein BB427_14015 [Pseudoalteromonas sp. BMB]